MAYTGGRIVKVSMETVEHIANLARLKLTQGEKERLTVDMEQIISYVDKLKEIDTSNVRQTDHIIDLKNVFREDKIESSYPRDKILMNAPEKEKGCFKVPKIME